VAEDKGGPPLPRRVPGTKRGPGAGPLTRPVLSESDLQRIRAALDSAHVQASAPPAERPAPLTQRVPGVGNGSEPPVLVGRLELSAALLPTRPEETPTETLPAVPAPTRPGDATEEIELKPEVAAQPGPAAAPAGPSADGTGTRHRPVCGSGGAAAPSSPAVRSPRSSSSRRDRPSS
jgi:hypothetical protein